MEKARRVLHHYDGPFLCYDNKKLVRSEWCNIQERREYALDPLERQHEISRIWKKIHQR